jgi:hypothetical protein
MNNCKNCQTETKNPNFCSLSCSASFNNRIKPSRKKSIQCAYCNSETFNPKFCSKSCAASYNNGIYPKLIKDIYYCKQCNNLINSRSKNFCSSSCRTLYRVLSIVNDESQIESRTAKKYLTYKYGHKCSICKISDWQSKPLVMILDHIDGNSENNLISNLRLICSNCDSQLPTYKSRNKGKGRHSRRLRYHNGLSY